MTRDRLRGLYAITPDVDDAQALAAKVRQALEGGAKLVQYRNKTARHAERVVQARALLDLCHRFGVPMIINDRVELALEVGADGVHLGQDELDIARARAVLGANSLIGASCYDSLERALEAARAGADYVAFGSVFPSTTKPVAVRASLGLLAAAKRQIELPIAAIGGITSRNAALVIDAGADLIAVISDLFHSDDISARAQALAQCFDKETQP